LITLLSRVKLLVSFVGGRRAAQFLLAECLRQRRIYAFRTSLANHPLTVRSSTSDFDVFCQIFVGQDLRFASAGTAAGLVIDCGANVGFSSAYLLTKHPAASLIAVEPDPGNFAALERNLHPYRERARAMRTGVWPQPSGLVIDRTGFRDGREWTRQAREARPGEEPEMAGVTIDELLQGSGQERIALLKVDIEGAEAILFAEGYTSWLDHVDVIAVELHDDSPFGDSTAAFRRAVADRRARLTRVGELTVCDLRPFD
jgi:FkbM family methyltransferase